MSERIGIVTGGGDCPGLNAVIRAAAKAAAKAQPGAAMRASMEVSPFSKRYETAFGPYTLARTDLYASMTSSRPSQTSWS